MILYHVLKVVSTDTGVMFLVLNVRKSLEKAGVDSRGVYYRVCGGAHPAALGSNSLLLDHHQFLGSADVPCWGLEDGRGLESLFVAQVTMVMKIPRRGGMGNRAGYTLLSALASFCTFFFMFHDFFL